jgi:hypothetical protein
MFELEIKCERLDWQLSSMTKIFSQQLPLLFSHVEHLEIREPHEPVLDRIEWKDDQDIDSSQWLGLFRLFTAVQSLYVSARLLRPVAAALHELTGVMAMAVFPALRNLSLEGLQPSGPAHDAVTSFITVRELTDHPVVIQPWNANHPFPPRIVVQSQLEG